MKKLSRKSVIIAVITVVCLASLIGYVIVQKNNSPNTNCKDIIGDGYAMGTDPEPVVIGNTCDP